MMRVAKRFHVVGKVQGVGFRYFTQQTAMTLGLDGWVRNETDGSVTAVASGSVEAIEAFAGYMGQGPTFAIVTSVTSVDESPQNYSGFDILR